MAKPRTPIALAEITGARSKNPKRFAGRSIPKIPPLGDPPARLAEAERAAWAEFASEIPWLAASDGMLVEIAARLTARLRSDPEISVAAITQLRLCLASMGATPADRSKVSAPDDEDDDPAARFFN